MTALEFIVRHMGSSIRLSEAERQYLGDPLVRRQLLREIHPRRQMDASGLLRILLELEAEDRHDGNNPGFYENLYWCAWLLCRLGRVEDVIALWRAKNISFDAGSGFDVQFLVGAGVDKTMRYLLAQSDPEAKAAHAHIKECRDAGDFDALKDWAAWREEYFAGISDAT